ncbi:class 1 fructose-bisphosphatase [Methylobacillus gramineus]|uniref:class 1 fructose-bisphosphatase n=1 Tax=Methylobacillus gramineus TaxID=755169 RepID=UPI001CFFDE55|nr:class 1 fructose-bisphosphatase [Methylobacillus gramineus]MCB5185109.1 class 1 fructose-bisphosphatase [Methylobacillus gramineus]
MHPPTLLHFFETQQHGVDHSQHLLSVIGDIAQACKLVAREVSHGALLGNMGNVGHENIQGEQQKTLDVISNDIFIKMAEDNPYIAGIASEEMEHTLEFSAKAGGFLLVFDPLDGSSNVNLNLSVGSIFSVLPGPDSEGPLTEQDFLQLGTQQVCAGYALYGTSTMLVLTTGQGVNGFTLDPDSGEFMLTHPAMRIAPEAQEFAINMSNQRFWQPPVQRYIDECLAGTQGARGKDFNMRWVASMVAEVHRLLIRGGVFLYPLDSRTKGKGGRLRLLYEASPMGWLIEQAGGLATTGHKRLLEIEPTALHQRVPVILGAQEEVELLLSYHSLKDPTA